MPTIIFKSLLLSAVFVSFLPSLAEATFDPFNMPVNYRVGIGTSNNQNAGLVVMTGNVGIGTWNPSGALDIKTGNNVLIENGNVGIGTWVTNAPVSFADTFGTKIYLGKPGSNAVTISQDDISTTSINTNGVLNLNSYSILGVNTFSLPSSSGEIIIYSVSDSTGLDLAVRKASLPTSSYVYSSAGTATYPFDT